mgnify:CR=1 FL=1
MMTLHAFKKALDNGEELDYAPYIKHNHCYRQELAKRGLELEEIIKYKDPDILYDVVNNDQFTQYYDQWKEDKDCHINVKRLIADKGYFPEYFVSLEDAFLSCRVLHKHPEYYEQLMRNSNTARMARSMVFNETQITQELIDYIIILNRHERHFPRNSVYIKWQAMHAETNILTKTMSWAHLYQTGNPLWAYPFSLAQIGVLRKLNQNAPLHLLEEVYQPNLTQHEMAIIARNNNIYQ